MRCAGGPTARLPPLLGAAAALLALCAAAAVQAANTTDAGPVAITEVMPLPKAGDAGGAWAELHNTGAAAVSLQNWVLAESPQDATGVFVFLPGNVLPPGGYLVVRTSKGAPGPVVAPGLKASKPLFLLRPDRLVSGSTGAGVKVHKGSGKPGQSYGVPVGAAPGAAEFQALAQATPGAANSAAAPLAPLITSVRHTPQAPARGLAPGTDVTVTAAVELQPGGAPLQAVTLEYLVGGLARALPMTPATATSDGSGGPQEQQQAYTATIPGAALTAGSLLRWRVKATDQSGGQAEEPAPGAPPGKGAEYLGLAVEAAGAANQTLPILYMFADNATAATSATGAPASLFWNGTYFDNLQAQRKGVSTLGWVKPKLKFSLPGSDLWFTPEGPSTNSLKTNSHYQELGQPSYMREPVAYQVMRESMMPASKSIHVVMYLNGQFWGLITIVQDPDTDWLKWYNLPTSGASTMYKSVSGELSNLRWDLPIAEMPNYYGLVTNKNDASAWELLANFTRGLAGGGPVPRSMFVFDALNLPAVINEMALQTLLGNLDRCSKNFQVYYNADTQEWMRVPWDVEASMGMDHMYGGTPGQLYCVLACEQWNSPLYCDSEHPQDLEKQTPWGQSTVVGLNPYQGSARGSGSGLGRRRLKQAVPALAQLPAAVGNPTQYVYPVSKDYSNPDRVQYGTKSINGAPGSYNHLTDAVLDVNATRIMYLRRLRTLADRFLVGGRLQQIIDEAYTKIKVAAAQDNAIWTIGDPALGYQQLVKEWIPVRTYQLLGLYAPGGARPLLPGPQPASGLSIAVEQVEPSQYIKLANRDANNAVDVSGWSLSNDKGSFTLPGGTVIPPAAAAYLSPNVVAFRKRSSSPRGGEGLLVVQADKAHDLFASGTFTLKDYAGNQVSQAAL